MNRNLFIGVDPGKSGAIAFIEDGSGDVWTVKLDNTARDLSEAILDAISSHCDDAHNCFAILERVHSSPQMGVKSAFSFGQSFGQVEMLLNCCDVPFEYVTPAKWQGDMGCRTGGDKNITKAAAQRLFPQVKVTHANADALLLAEYARRHQTKINEINTK